MLYTIRLLSRFLITHNIHLVNLNMDFLQSLSESDRDSPSTSSHVSGSQNRAAFMEKVKQSNDAIHKGEFDKAVLFYTEAIAMDPQNHVLFSNR